MATCAGAGGNRLFLPFRAVSGAFLLLAILGLRGIVTSTAPWWRHEWLSATVAFFAVAAAAMYAAVHRTAETLTLFSAHGRAKLLFHAGGPGTLRAFRMFLPRLEAHLRIAGARRRAGADHLRDASTSGSRRPAR
jgi:hypothetical protein